MAARASPPTRSTRPAYLVVNYISPSEEPRMPATVTYTCDQTGKACNTLTFSLARRSAST